MTDLVSVAIKRINPPELGVPPGYSQVVEVRGGRIIFISGQPRSTGMETLSARVIFRAKWRRCSAI